MTLEDETGVVNVIVWGSTAEKYRQPFLQAQLLEICGRLQHEKGVMHGIAEDLVDRSACLDHCAHLRGTLDSGKVPTRLAALISGGNRV